MLHGSWVGSAKFRFSLVLVAAALVAAGVVGVDEGLAQDGGGEAEAADQPRASVIAFPIMDSARGRRLFVSKGCVICHAINEIGGRAAPALDVDKDAPYVDAFEFMARMWRGSVAMASLQSTELGYQIELSGSELADIVAFVSDVEQQRAFSQDDIPDIIEDWILDKPYEDWEDVAPWE